jgi:hypothetical protein
MWEGYWKLYKSFNFLLKNFTALGKRIYVCVVHRPQQSALNQSKSDTLSLQRQKTFV